MDCPTCAGSGDIEAQDRPIEDGGAIWIDCPDCGGTGERPDDAVRSGRERMTL